MPMLMTKWEIEIFSLSQSKSQKIADMQALSFVAPTACQPPGTGLGYAAVTR